jgi:hypothetical protein
MRKNLGVETGLGAINILGVDSGVDFYCLNFSLALASNTLVYKVIYRTRKGEFNFSPGSVQNLTFGAHLF